MRLLLITLVLSSSCLLPGLTNAQQPAGTDRIRSLIEKDSLQKAQKLIDQDLELLTSQNLADSILRYIPLAGSFKLSGNNIPEAIRRAEKLTSFVRHRLTDPVDQKKALMALCNLYFDARMHQKYYDANQEALQLIRKSDSPYPADLSELEYNSGNALLYLGRSAEAISHFYNARRILEDNKAIDARQFYNVYNNLGRIKGQQQQPDSALYYYRNALHALDRYPEQDFNRFYWSAIIENNMALIYQNTGSTQEGMEHIERSIRDYQHFLDHGQDESRLFRAKRNRLATIDNLGTFYFDLGMYNRAIELFTYSYQRKQLFLEPSDPDIVFSQVILGDAHLIANNLEESRHFLDTALTRIESRPEVYVYLHSYALTLRASLAEAQQDSATALTYYQKSEQIHLKNFQGIYTREDLSTLLDISRFYARQGRSEKALNLARNGYDYTHQPAFDNKLVQFDHTRNMAAVSFLIGDYTHALSYSKEALDMFSQGDLTAGSYVDSVQITFRKPAAILISCKARYALDSLHDAASLLSLREQIESGLEILERRKEFVKNSGDVKLLLSENNDLYDFAEKLNIELYEKTREKTYLYDLLSLHESRMYNRIRSRLAFRKDLRFSGLPDSVMRHETQLREALNKALTPQGSFTSYLSSLHNWDDFLKRLKSAYPRYYRMRYATHQENIQQIFARLPEDMSVVRYLFVDGELYALPITRTTCGLFHLNTSHLKENILGMNQLKNGIERLGPACHQLYDALWRPFSREIQGNRLVIIPDGPLFNLGFEMLVPEDPAGFRELADKSLLARYVISYNYSLLLVNDTYVPEQYDAPFIGYAPEFNHTMKEQYREQVHDSLRLDLTYLTLLPQPFSLKLISDFANRFNGTSYYHHNASKSQFIATAGGHEIIHVGTHAQSNNVSPELSRLWFAKDVSDSLHMEDNVLYSYELYDCDLTSRLAILSGCETGKPSFEPGEGMLSLAHAFNYAGSESMITGLWDIDEQSSAQILSLFYEGLAGGLSTAEALQKAKLEYIRQAEGRTVHPSYWAGMILVGDSATLDMPTSTPFWQVILWMFSGLMILILALMWRRRKIHLPDNR